MLVTAAILSLVFIVESKRAGPAFIATFLTHGLFNTLTIVFYM